ncbi:MAG: hypothetical protein WBG46_14290 [Nonlabens sp.]
MKPNYLYFILIFPIISFAQSVEIGAGAGGGALYLLEDIDTNTDIDFSSAGTLYVDLKYNFADRPDGIKLRYQSMSALVYGRTYLANQFIDGKVEGQTFSLLYERLRSHQTINFGFNAGLGHTIETLNLVPRPGTYLREINYATLSGAGILSYQLNDALSLRAEMGFLWTDPINTFRGSENWQTAGEDVSLLLQFGITYTIPFSDK